MGKAKRDGSTPEKPTAIERLALTPEQRAAFQRMMSEKLEQAARLDKAARAIDRTLAIRDGLIPPPWAEKLRQPAEKAKAKSNSEMKLGWQVRRAIPILIELYPPTGIPPDNVLLKVATTDVNKVLTERQETPPIKPDSVRRAIHVLKERNAPLLPVNN
jgi:hypothetical protein